MPRPTQLLQLQRLGQWPTKQSTKKCVKYAHLDHNHIFTPIAIETSGVYGSETLKFLKELGHRLKQTSGECNAYSYLLQRLSVAVQRGNATSVMGSVDQHAVEDFFQ